MMCNREETGFPRLPKNARFLPRYNYRSSASARARQMVHQAQARSVDWVKSEPRYGEDSECLEVRG